MDLNYPIHMACLEAGLAPTYAAMAVQRPAAPVAPARDGRLRIATCGSLIKYRQPGRYRWVDYVRAALQAPDSELIHIGPVDDAFRAEVSTALAEAGIDPARYVYAGVVPNLMAELAAAAWTCSWAATQPPASRANPEPWRRACPRSWRTTPTRRRSSPTVSLRGYRVSAPEELPPLLARLDELSRSARSPAALASVEAQLGRFDDYIAGKALLPLEDVGTLPD
ncbi:MAG: hypothetical protein KIS90_00840 [Phenylobacterium sp.]|nr:hypothetical protein [Phenylobacterium sp.]